MNQEQKQAAADRLAKAREERYKKNPPAVSYTHLRAHETS